MHGLSRKSQFFDVHLHVCIELAQMVRPNIKRQVSLCPRAHPAAYRLLRFKYHDGRSSLL